MVMFLCRKLGYVKPETCLKCTIPDDRKIAKGKVDIDRGQWRGETVPPGSCPWFEGTVDTCMEVETPFTPRKIGVPFKRRYF